MLNILQKRDLPAEGRQRSNNAYVYLTDVVIRNVPHTWKRDYYVSAERVQLQRAGGDQIVSREVGRDGRAYN